MKIMALIPYYRRMDTAAICLPHYLDLGIEVVAVCDSSDASYLNRYEHVTICNADNYFPGKLDAGLRYMKQLEWDAVLMMGCDDILDLNLLNALKSNLTNGIDLVGITDCYFYDININYTMKWPGYPSYHHRHGEPAGAWRLYSRYAIESVDYSLWDCMHGATDKHSWDKANGKIKSIGISTKDNGYGIDIKDGLSMTPLSAFDYITHVTRRERDDIINIVNKYRTDAVGMPQRGGGV